MSRRRKLTELLIGYLIGVAALSGGVWLALTHLSPASAEVALWVSGALAGIVAGPLIRAWLALAALRLAGRHAVRAARASGQTPARTGGRARTAPRPERGE